MSTAKAIKSVKPKASKQPKVLTKEDLLTQINLIREEATALKRNMHQGDVQNVRAYKYKKRDLARLLTKYNSFVPDKGDK